MAREEIQVNPDLIAWARKRAGLTLEEASKKFNRIAAWEAGDASPTYLQLERLAGKLKLPLAVFFFPEPPSLPPIRESFRILPDAEFDMIPRQVFCCARARPCSSTSHSLARAANRHRV